jgi:hypothetical protein
MFDVLNFVERMKKENREKLTFFEILLHNENMWDKKNNLKRVVKMKESNIEEATRLMLMGLVKLLDQQRMIMNIVVASAVERDEKREWRNFFKEKIEEIIALIREEYRRIILVENNFRDVNFVA